MTMLNIARTKSGSPNVRLHSSEGSERICLYHWRPDGRLIKRQAQKMQDWQRRKKETVKPVDTVWNLIKITFSSLKDPLVPARPKHNSNETDNNVKRDRQKHCFGISFLLDSWLEGDRREPFKIDHSLDLNLTIQCQRNIVCFLRTRIFSLLINSVDYFIFNSVINHISSRLSECTENAHHSFPISAILRSVIWICVSIIQTASVLLTNMEHEHTLNHCRYWWRQAVQIFSKQQFSESDATEATNNIYETGKR